MRSGIGPSCPPRLHKSVCQKQPWEVGPIARAIGPTFPRIRHFIRKCNTNGNLRPAAAALRPSSETSRSAESPTSVTLYYPTRRSLRHHRGLCHPQTSLEAAAVKTFILSIFPSPISRPTSPSRKASITMFNTTTMPTTS